MNMKKKVATLGLVAAMLLTSAGATLAYFTDTDADTNVMTLGNVAITQNERDQFGSDITMNPEDGVKLLPMVDNRSEGDAVVDADGFFNDKMKNVVDKVVTVTNDGSEGAYVRTILAFETAKEYKEGSQTEVLRDGKEIFDTYLGTLGSFDLLNETVEIEGVEYVLAVKVYEEILPAGETTTPSLKQIFMAPTADNEVTTLFGNEYNILALSQGVQAAGFDNGAVAALNEAFGEVTPAKFVEWFAAVNA